MTPFDKMLAEMEALRRRLVGWCRSDGEIKIMDDCIEIARKYAPVAGSEISVVEECKRNAELNNKTVLEMLDLHIVDYPTPESIVMQRKYMSALKAMEPVSIKHETPKSEPNLKASNVHD